MAEPDQEGSLDPTQRRRDDARMEGQVVSSPDVSAAAAVLAFCMFLMWFGGTMGDRLLGSFRVWFEDARVSEWTILHSRVSTQWFYSEMFAACGSMVLLLMVVGLMAAFAQVGFTISTKPMEIDFEKMSPAKGWQRLISFESAIRGGMGVSKVILLLLVSVAIMWARRHEFSAANFSSVQGLVSYTWNLGLTVCLSLAMVAMTLAAVDYITRWFQHEHKLKMTHEEVKREQKEEMGDPTIKAAARRRQREAMKNQSVASVPDATVVMTNPTHYAVALQYVPGKMKAPRLVAKGAGDFAANIVSIARSHNIPVIQRPPLTRAIFRSVSVGQEIPLIFFRAVAEILGEVYRSKRNRTSQTRTRS